MRARPGREVRNCGAQAAAAERGEPSGGDRAAAGRANALVSGPEDAHDGAAFPGHLCVPTACPRVLSHNLCIVFHTSYVARESGRMPAYNNTRRSYS